MALWSQHNLCRILSSVCIVSDIDRNVKQSENNMHLHSALATVSSNLQKLLWVHSFLFLSLPSICPIPCLLPYPSTPLFPLLPAFTATESGGALKLVQWVRQTTFGAFWGRKSASGESSFSVFRQIFASAYKTEAFRWRKLQNGDRFLWVLDYWCLATT